MDQVALLRDLGIRHGDSLLIVRGGDKPAAAAAETQGNQGQVKEQITAPVMVKRSIPDDNSCLFNAVAYVLMNGRKDQSRQLRQCMRFHDSIQMSLWLLLVIAETVRKHPDLYSEVMLGQPVDDYCRIITGSNSWGGAIELSIFAQHFQTEIVSIDVETCKPYHFGEGSGYDRRVFVLYSGIHYDALAQTSHPANASLDKTVFDATDDLVLIQALSVAEQEQRAKRFTNTNTFTLRCMDCGTALVGHAEAQVSQCGVVC